MVCTQYVVSINIKEYEMKRYNSMKVEVIKLGLYNIEDLGLSSKDVLFKIT